MDLSHDEVVADLCATTGISPEKARDYLEANEWDIEAAAENFFHDEELQSANQGGGRSLGGAEPNPLAGRSLGDSSSHSRSATPQQSSVSRMQAPKKGIATLGDFQSGGGNFSDDDENENQDFFAGGEKSGLAVQNPDDIRRKIIENATRTQPPGYEESEPKRTFFTGPARTLGGDDTPSREIEAPSVRPATRRRTLHFWTDGVTIDDGDYVYSYEEFQLSPGAISQGFVTITPKLRKILDIKEGQEADVAVAVHPEEAPKRKPGPFSGAGHRLGAPSPNVRSESDSTAPTPTTPEAANPEIDESQPVVNLQVRLAVGRPLRQRFNTSHTIGDVYRFVRANTPATTRRWVLMTTFPNKDLTDESAIIGELDELKRGGTVQQKWLN